MSDSMTENEFAKHLDALTSYGGSPKTVMAVCTCPIPEGCVCDQSDDENGETVACPACVSMEHTEPTCMIRVFQNWRVRK